jgi:hypothetical protein
MALASLWGSKELSFCGGRSYAKMMAILAMMRIWNVSWLQAAADQDEG